MKHLIPEKVRQFFFLVLLSIYGVHPVYLSEIIPAFLSGCDTFYVLMRKYMKSMLIHKMAPAVCRTTADVGFIYYDFVSGFYFDKYRKF